MNVAKKSKRLAFPSGCWCLICYRWDMEFGKVRVWRSVAEKRRIEELKLQPGMSVARVAHAKGVNSHQVFQWHRAYREGGLDESDSGSRSLLPVVVAESNKKSGEEDEEEVFAVASGSIHIEFPGRATISVERGTDMHLLRTVLASLRQ